MDNQQLFVNACKEGRLDDAKIIYSSEGRNINDTDECAFRYACANGHLLVVQWLYSLDTNIHANSKYAFGHACENGHLIVAQWLYSLDVNIHANDEYAFRWACYNGHLDVVVWLYSLDKIDINFDDSRIMRLIGEEGIDALSFLLENGADFRGSNGRTLERLCSWKNKYAITKILLPHCDESDYHLFDQDIIRELLNKTKNARSAKIR